MLEAIAIGVFVFVVIVVSGWRILNTIEANSAKVEAERIKRIANRSRCEYSGGYFNAHGREIQP